MGKRLIGKAMAKHPAIGDVLEKGTLVIIAGTTNGYVAEEILNSVGQSDGFSRIGFRRGISVAPGAEVIAADLTGDVVICDGEWIHNKTIFDVADDLKVGDIVLKGANALDTRGQAAVFVAHPTGGTVLATLSAVVGRRVQLIVPVGLEKRVFEDVHVLARRCNAQDAKGPRLLPVPGEVFTELDAVSLITGASVCLTAAGGTYGAEGAVWLGVSGTNEQIEAASDLIKSVSNEPPCYV